MMTAIGTGSTPQDACLADPCLAHAGVDVDRRRRLLVSLAAVSVATMGAASAGCSLPFELDHDGADAPSDASLAKAPRVAWVFGSGGPRGFVHVGVLKALDALGLRPELVVGASVGALVGVLYASGRDGPSLERLALELQPWAIGALALGSRERFSGAPLALWVREQLRQPLLEQQPLPVVCVARRLSDGAVVGFSRGDAGVAVQASAAIEGQFTPVRIRGAPHADADLAMPLPVRLARRLGAQRVLAVDASAHEDRAPPGAERFRAGDLRKRALIQPDATAADLLLHPEFGYWVNLSREFRERCIAAGFQATMAQAEALRRLHSGAGLTSATQSAGPAS